jgi:hypothetical protein
MIRSYGLHWKQDQVFWGRQKVSGTLLGAASRSKNANQIDFAMQRGIYALYADYELVYIGQTGGGETDRLLKRLRLHKRDHLTERWNRFSWFGTQRVTQQHLLSKDNAKVSATVPEVLNILEAIATAISEPRLNLSRGHWSTVKQYYQVPLTEEAKVAEEEEED